VRRRKKDADVLWKKGVRRVSRSKRGGVERAKKPGRQTGHEQAGPSNVKDFGYGGVFGGLRREQDQWKYWDKKIHKQTFVTQLKGLWHIDLEAGLFSFQDHTD